MEERGGHLAIRAGRQLDLSGHTVLPGLIDCHTHLVGEVASASLPVDRSAAQEAFSGVRNVRATVMAGFTTVRDVGTFRAFVDVALRDAIADGTVVGPRMVVAGAHVTVPGGGGEVTGLAPDVVLPADLRFGVAASAAEVRTRARAILHGGADFIKVIATGAVLTPGDPARGAGALGGRDPRGGRGGGGLRHPRRRPRARHPGHRQRRPGRRPVGGARLDAGRRGRRAAGGPRRLPGRRHLQRRLDRGPGPQAGLARRDAGQERGDHPGPAGRLRQGGPGRRADRLRHRRRRLPARLERQAAPLHGAPRDDPHGGPPLGDRGRGRAARLGGPARHNSRAPLSASAPYLPA
jgi:Amidohydrolase family